MQAFYNEVAVMKRASRRGNPHIITMVGYIPREYPPAIVMEFAPLSTLLKFLMKVKDDVSVVHMKQELVCVTLGTISTNLDTHFCRMTILCNGNNGCICSD